MKIAAFYRIFDNQENAWRDPVEIESGINEFKCIKDARLWLANGCEPKRQDFHPHDISENHPVRIRYEIRTREETGEPWREVDCKTYECRLTFLARELK